MAIDPQGSLLKNSRKKSESIGKENECSQHCYIKNHTSPHSDEESNTNNFFTVE